METNTPRDWDSFWSRKQIPFFQGLKSSFTRELAGFLRSYSGRFLEAGCGEALMMGGLKDHFSVVGIDFSREACRQAKRRIPSVVHGDIHRMPFKGAFDVVFNQSVIPADADPGQTIRDMLSVTRKGGHVIFTIPKKQSIFHFLSRLGPLNPVKWPIRTIYWNEEEIRKIVSRFSKVVEVHPLWYGQLLIIVIRKGGK